MRRLTSLLLAIVTPWACQTHDEPHVLRIEPAGEGLGFSSEPLFRSPRLSAHRAVAQTPLPAHLHRHSEENIYVLAGEGRMRIGAEWYELGPGSLIHVPEGVVHALVPRGVMTAISIFSPPLDEHDREFVVEAEPPSGDRP